MKQSTLSKAKAANEAKAKADKKRKTTAKATETVTALLSQQSGTETGLQDIGKTSNVKVPLFSSVSVETSGNKPEAQRLAVTDEQMAFVLKAANSEDFSVILANLGREMLEKQFLVHCICVAVAYRLQKDSKDALALAIDFLEQLRPLGAGKTMVRTNAVRDWLCAFACVKWDKPNNNDAKTFVIDSAKRAKFNASMRNEGKKFIAERLAIPFWTFKPEREPGEFSLADAFDGFMKQANAIMDQSTENLHKKYKKVDMTGIKKLRDFAKDFKEYLANAEKNTLLDDTVTNDPATSESVEQKKEAA